MRFISPSFFILFLAYSSHVQAEDIVVSLEQCAQWARHQSENLKKQKETIQQSEAKAQSAFATILPDVSWNWHHTWQEPQGVDEMERRGFVGFSEKKQQESKFSVHQPLFGGFKEFSAWHGFKKQMKRDELLYRRADLDLYEQTALAFYSVILHETSLKNTLTTLKLSLDRVKELQSFVRLGKARESEVFTAQAHAATLKANIDQIQASIVATREDLSFLTGREEARTAMLRDDMSQPPATDSLEAILALAQQRSDIQAMKEEVLANQHRVRYEKGSHWPDIDLFGNYFTKRNKMMDPIDWDVDLAVRIPLYQGGSVASRVREALSQYRQAQFGLEQLQRKVTHHVRRLYHQLKITNDEATSLEEATSAAQKSYDALLKEYRLGLVTNLDVLQALDLLQADRNALDNARLRAKLIYIQLNLAMENNMPFTDPTR